MPKRTSEDEIMDMTYNKLFGDLDRIESGSMFKEGGEGDVEGVVPNAKGLEGIELTIKPIMAAAAEGGRESSGDEVEEEDKLKGISGFSPLMAQLHGER